MQIEGTWHINEMELWDEDYLHMETQAYITIDNRGNGEFQFGLVHGAFDGEVVKDEGTERLEFTWEGNDECDHAFGSGWLKIKDAETLQGRIAFHAGDRSTFVAQRA